MNFISGLSVKSPWQWFLSFKKMHQLDGLSWAFLGQIHLRYLWTTQRREWGPEWYHQHHQTHLHWPQDHHSPASRGPKAKATCPCPPGQLGGEESHLEQGKVPLSGCLRRICLAEGLAPAAGASSGMCQQLGSNQSWVRRERRSRVGRWVQKGGAEVTCDQWDALNTGAHGKQLHTCTCPQTPMSFGCYWPVLGSCVVFPQKILQQMSVYGCGIVSGWIIEPGAGKIEEKPQDLPTISQQKFCHSLLCVS